MLPCSGCVVYDHKGDFIILPIGMTQDSTFDKGLWSVLFRLEAFDWCFNDKFNSPVQVPSI